MRTKIHQSVLLFLQYPLFPTSSSRTLLPEVQSFLLKTLILNCIFCLGTPTYAGVAFVGELRVSNNTAERGITLYQAINSKITKSGDQHKDLLQVVEEQWRLQPEASKKGRQAED